MASLESVFKKVFSEGLAPYGFIKAKVRYPYFLRLIGDEIIHVITYAPTFSMSPIPNAKAFDIRCGVATVYRKVIDLGVSARKNSNWLVSDSRLYVWNNLFDYDKEIFYSITQFNYIPDNDDSLTDEVKRSLDVTKRTALPVLDKVNDLDSCIDFFSKFRPTLLNIYRQEGFGAPYSGWMENESLLYFRAYSLNSYIKSRENDIERYIEEEAYFTKAGKQGHTQEKFDKLYKDYIDGKPARIAQYTELYSDRDWIAKALEEAERRKSSNTDLLRSYGLSL